MPKLARLAGFLKSRRGLLFLFLALVAIGVVITVPMARAPEPSFQGRTAEDWLQLTVTNGVSLRQATEAFVEMGPRSVRFLGEALDRKPSSLDKWLLDHHRNIPVRLRSVLLKPKHQHQQTTILKILENLNTNALPALPALLAWLEKRGDRISIVTTPLTTNGFSFRSNSLAFGFTEFPNFVGHRPNSAPPVRIALMIPQGETVQLLTQAVVSAPGVISTNVTATLQSRSPYLPWRVFQILTNLGGDDPRIITALANPVDGRSYSQVPAYSTNLTAAALRSIPLLLQESDSVDPYRKLNSLGLLRLTVPHSTAAREYMIRQLLSSEEAIFNAAIDSLRTTTNDLERIIPPAVRGLVGFNVQWAVSNTPAYKALKEFARHSPLVASSLQETIRAAHPSSEWGAIELLGEVGTTNDVDLALIKSFTEMEPPRLRALALVALGQITRNKETIAQGYLIYLDLGHTDWPLFDRIGALGPAAAVAVPHLVKMLESSEERYVAKAAETLVKLGPAAAPALPQLEKLRTHPHLLVREPVEAAIRNIEAGSK